MGKEEKKPSPPIKSSKPSPAMTGKEFRMSLGKRNTPIREVEPFSMQSNQNHTIVRPPPKIDVFKPIIVKNSLFRKYYLRGDIPICKTLNKVDENTDIKTYTNLQWKVPPKDLDYMYYLPIFFEGLCESEDPYKSFARGGVADLLKVGGDKILPCIPHLIIPIKQALNTKLPDVIMETLKLVQKLLKTGPCIGQSLVPYYRQLLPIFNLFRCVDEVGDVIETTLQQLENYGGPDAFINIKYMVPTYESTVRN